MHTIVLGQMSAPDTDRICGLLIMALLIAIAAFIGYLNYQNAKPFRIEATTVLQPVQTLDALQAQFARDGWSLSFRDDSRLIMQADRNANLGTTAAIGCFSVWLALLHLATARRTLTLEISATETTTGSVIVANGSQCGGNLLNYTTRRLGELPKS